MNERLDGWLNGARDDGETDGWLPMWMDRWMGRCVDGWMGGCVDGWMGGLLN